MINNSSSLQILQVSFNNLSGAIPPSIALLRSLHTLDLSFNFLNNALPESLYTLSQLRSIDLSSNLLTGSISSSIHNLQALQTLSLSTNLFSGAIPPRLGSLVNLSFLDFSSNKLDPAPFPPFLGNLSNLVFLDLSYNSFNSSIPPEWHNLTLLAGLTLSGNALGAPPSLPSWVFRHPLRSLRLSSLQLPSASFACDVFRYVNTTINTLDLSLNNLNSTAQLLNDCLTRISFPSLALLNLSHNPLNSSLISSSKLLTPGLRILNLGSCGLQGNIPDNFVPNIVGNLDLSNNQLTGELPAGFGNFSQMQDMDLSHNYLTSSKQPNISGSNNFYTLLLSDNQFKGELGYFLANFGKADDTITQGRFWRVVDVSFNQFTGMIPPYLANCTSLERIKMGNNELKGRIPADLGFLEWLSTLSLHGNQLEGTIPSTLFNCSSLQVLDLGHNSLSGELEDVFFSSSYNLSSLRVLLLGNNQLGGAIPASLGMSSPNLQLLDLSNNHFNGSIPPHLHLPAFAAVNDHQQSTAAAGTLFEDGIIIEAKGTDIHYTYILNVLTSFDFSGNSLSGSIPPTLGDLTGLKFLNLSRNRLTGAIPIELSKLRALESLDLSFNNITGSIPVELKDISALAVFNVSYNEELRGAIPAGASQLMNPWSYVGNPKLCGTPLQSCRDVINSTQGAANPKRRKSSAGVDLQEWASLPVPGILLGLLVGFVCTLCLLHVKVKSSSMFERLFNLLKASSSLSK